MGKEKWVLCPICNNKTRIKVRPILRRLAEVAERTGCAVILIGHLNKAAGGKARCLLP